MRPGNTEARSHAAAAVASARTIATARGAAIGPGAVVTTVDDAALLRPLAAALHARGKDALLAASTAAGTQVLLARADGSALDCGALLGRLAAATGGRGGGKATHAEGRLPAIADWSAAVAAAATA